MFRWFVDGSRRTLWSVVVALLVIVLVFFAIRLLTDVPLIVTGRRPSPRAFELRYVTHPLPAYVHIVPGVVYLVGAPWQLWRRFRARHPVLHRRLGRALLGVGFVSGALALVVGIWFPYGGELETSASIVFGLYFLGALASGFAAVRRRDVARHRRWMIRAFAVALGVGTIRVWIGIFELTGLLAIQDDTGTGWFGAAFWIAFVLHAAAAEAYLVARPTIIGSARERHAPADA